MKIRFFAALAVVFSAVGFGVSPKIQTATSARCAIPPFERAYSGSKAVFLGEVAAEEKQGDVRKFWFKVEKYWKGADAERIEILVYETARFQAWFKEGGKYLVYAESDEDGKLRVVRCSRSRDIEDAGEDLQKLGEGKIPR